MINIAGQTEGLEPVTLASNTLPLSYYFLTLTVGSPRWSGSVPGFSTVSSPTRSWPGNFLNKNKNKINIYLNKLIFRGGLRNVPVEACGYVSGRLRYEPVNR